MAAPISKEDYLKRYLSDNAEEKKKKRRKKAHTSVKVSRVTIFDDDIDLKSLQPDNLGNTFDDDVGDNEPTVAEFVDERPEHIKLLEKYRLSGAWKTFEKTEERQSKKRHDSDSDNSPPRRNRHDSDSDQSSLRRQRHDSDSDQSPSRRQRHDSDSDQSPSRRQRHDSDSDHSPVRKQRHDSDSDQSPARKQRHDSDSDQSPPRKKHSKSKSETGNAQKHSKLKHKRNDSDSDQSPRRKKTKTSSSRSKTQSTRTSGHKSDSDQSPRRRRQNSDSDPSPLRRRGNKSDSDQSPPRRRGNESDSDQSPPRRRGNESFKSKDPARNGSRSEKGSKKKDEMTLGGKKAGLSSAKDMRREAEELRRKEDESFGKISDDRLGKGSATVFRDKSSGRKRDLVEEKKKASEEAKIKEKEDVKFKQWGKGLKQIEEQSHQLETDLYETSKPLARYKDDEDLDKMLRDMDRAEDPMLAFMKKKKSKTTGPPVNEKPRYKGPAPPPNRFGLMPGYRWDGVDRSNGFEKQMFSKIAEKKATAIHAYKWSTEDM